MAIHFPATYNLFGTSQGGGVFKEVPNPAWTVPGGAFTSMTMEFYFESFQPHAEPVYCNANVVWATESVNIAGRFCDFSNGEVKELGIIQGNGSGAPVANGVHIASKLRESWLAAKRLSLMFQVKGDSVHSYSMFRLQAYVVWKLP